MGAPAARLGDMTAHGGAITTGCPNVLIGGMPAARVTDMHACPMVTVLVPHVGGPIVQGSMTVITGMMPQARMGDMAVCVGPPDAIVLGQFNVLVGDAGASAGGGDMGAGAGMAGLGGALIGAVMGTSQSSMPSKAKPQALGAEQAKPVDQADNPYIQKSPTEPKRR